MNLSNIRKRRESVTSLKTTIPRFKMVFLNRLYIAIAAAVFTTFWIIFNVFDQLLFFSPVWSFYLPDDAITGFVITNITSVLMGILIAMNIYVIRNSKIRLDRSLFSGSILGIASSACASCSSIGFLIISTLGGFGIFATDFLTNYQIPLRIVSITILLWALYSVHNKITKPCTVKNTFHSKERNTTVSRKN
ncbi:MAG TPA: hypothetical protein VE971_02925 [Candidatus Eisenbacteria bacterium]|nr:hypothetical protein [Candidatus Eisenbacteria bacterium]